MAGGIIVQVIGAVVDVEFPRDAMPRVFDALTVDNTDIMLEVQQQLGDGIVRTIAQREGADEIVDLRLGVAHLSIVLADLHAAGAGVVVASLWPAGDRSNAELMAGFYARLQAGGDIVEAFASARRARIDRARPDNLRQWAGFQLFIR